MLKIYFRKVLPNRTGMHINNEKYSFKVVVSQWIKDRYRVRYPKLEKGVTSGYDDDRGEYMEVLWLVNNGNDLIQEKIIWLEYVASEVNSKRILRNRELMQKNMEDENQ